MELYRAPRLGLVTYTFIRTIVGIHKTFLPPCGKRVGVHCKAVILRCDVAPLRSRINARLILRAMAIFQFVGLCPRSEGEQLIAEAHAEDGLALFHRATYLLSCF